MFNGKYKKGMADASKAYQAFGQKQEEALNHILEEVRQGRKSIQDVIAELGDNVDLLYGHLQSKEKASLYTVYTPFDIKELGNEERLLLLGALLRLTMDKTPNENQQSYIRAVQRYLEIKEPPFGFDVARIEEIENVPWQKAILQAVLEYLRLQDGESYDETELQQEFLDAFNLNNRIKNEIIHRVELLYGMTGAQGLAEKYGYVPEEEPESEESKPVGEVSSSSSTENDVKMSEDIADQIASFLYGANLSTRRPGDDDAIDAEYIIETARYIVITKKNSTWAKYNSANKLIEDGLYTIEKATGEQELLISQTEMQKLLLYGIQTTYKVVDYDNDILLAADRKQGYTYGDVNYPLNCYLVNVGNKTFDLVYSSKEPGTVEAVNKDYLVLIDRNECQLLHMKTGKRKLINQANYHQTAVFMGTDLYIGLGTNIFRYDTTTKKKEKWAYIRNSSPITELRNVGDKGIVAITFNVHRYGENFQLYYFYFTPEDGVNCKSLLEKPSECSSTEVSPVYCCYNDGIVCSLDSSPQGCRGFTFDLEYLDFATRTIRQLAHIKEGESGPIQILKLGDYIYFVKRVNERKKNVRMKVSLLDPEDVEIM